MSANQIGQGLTKSRVSNFCKARHHTGVLAKQHNASTALGSCSSNLNSGPAEWTCKAEHALQPVRLRQPSWRSPQMSANSAAVKLLWRTRCPRKGEE